jgi:hypothetical protein
MLEDEVVAVLSAFDREDITRALPLLAWSMAASCPDLEIPSWMATSLGVLLIDLGLDQDASSEEITSAVARHYEEHPPPRGLLGALAQVFRRDRAKGDDGALASALEQMTGSRIPRKALERTAPPPEGAVAGGPLARFQISVPGDQPVSKARRARR